MLELWSWNEGKLQKVGEIGDVANHVSGTRAIDMSVVADFNGDGLPDIAIPSLDRKRLRLVTFAPNAHELSALALPAAATTNIALVAKQDDTPAIALGLANGRLALMQRVPPPAP
jgi:hypothetical protein